MERAGDGRPTRDALFFWSPLALLCLALYFGLIQLSQTLSPDLRENSNDLAIYRETGERLLLGDLPYRDFFVEYPPGSLPAFVPPALFSDDSASFVDLFSAEMALVLAATLALVALTARQLRGARSWLLPAVAFVVAALLLYPVAVTRYDAVVALALALGCVGAAFGGRYRLLAYASLGFGTAAKLVPALATLPLALARRGAGRGYAAFFAALALFFVPAAIFGGGGFLQSFAYHADRGLQIESVPASILMAPGWVDGVVFEFGAFEARGRGVEAAAGLSLPLTVLLLLVTGFAMWRGYRRSGFVTGDFPRYAAALILAFMLGSKVLSPQYAIWLLPLVPLCAGGLAGVAVCLLFLAACWTTTQIFPTHYADLLNLRAPGPQLLLLRNALFIALWGVLLFRPRGKGSGEASP